jgi:hypothetical protein
MAQVVIEHSGQLPQLAIDERVVLRPEAREGIVAGSNRVMLDSPLSGRSFDERNDC